MADATSKAFLEFVSVIKALRDPVSGCPWDLEQTHESLRPYLIEECYELLDAIEAKNDEELKAELGDVLLQVVLHAQLSSERNAFNISDVISYVSDKMVRRHPHVFGKTKVDGSSDVVKNWEQIKQSERLQKGSKEKADTSRLSGIPTAMPALIRAQRLGEKAAKANFDWRNLADVFSKVKEEISELEAELPEDQTPPNISEERKKRLCEEMGDVLFALCQLSRWLGFSAEDSLRESATKFSKRFQSMEENTQKPIETLNDQELDAAWETAKKKV